MADQNGTNNPWDSQSNNEPWNPSGAPDGTADEKKQDTTEHAAPATPPDQPATPPAQPTQPVQPTPASTASPSYRPAPEYGANPAGQTNPTEPLPPSSYPFGVPEKKEAPTQQNKPSGSDQGRTGGLFGQQPTQQMGNPFFGGNQAPQGQQGQQSQQNPNGQYGQNGPQGSQGPNGPQTPFFNNPNGTNGNRSPQGAAAARAQQQKKSGSGKTWLAAIASALIAALLVLGLGYAAIVNGLVRIPSASNLSSLTSVSGGDGTAKVEGGDSPDWAAVNKKVAASVVSIQARVTGGTAAGSGAVLDTEGNIVTNNHVVEGSSEIQVTLSDGNVYRATIVGTDATTDLAVIKLENGPSDLQPVTFADSSKLAVGEAVMAIGNPLGYSNTATTGIVSALNRPVSVTDESGNGEIVTNAVQIDAAVNPGNSGGPSFNAAGEVIGINSSIASTSTTQSDSSTVGSIGIGFAIPSALVERVAKEIIANGSVQHAQLGVTITNGSAQADNATRAGALVNSVTDGGAASKAGIKQGDVIVGFDGNAVSSMYSLLGFVRAAAVNDTVKLTVIRDGKALDIDVTLTQAEAAQSNDSNDDQNQDDDQGGDDGGLSDPFGLFGN